jgi:hypothetical protein
MAQPTNFNNPWQWVYDFQNEARRKGDRLREQLCTLCFEATNYKETDPDKAISRLKQGRGLAEVLNEPLWVMFYDYLLSTVLIWDKRDTAAGLDLAVRVAVSASAPEYRHWPFTPSVHYALLNAYSSYDPLSYRDEILTGATYLDNELNSNCDIWKVLPSLRHSLYCSEENIEAAMHSLDQYFERGQGNSYMLCRAYYRLCSHHFVTGQYRELMEASEIGVQHAQLRNHCKLVLIKLQIWQAIAAFGDRNVDLSQQYYRNAVTTMRSLGDAIQRDQIGNLAIYYEFTYALDNALAYRNEIVACALVHGSPYHEYAARLGRCRLLKIMGLLTEEEIEATRNVRNQFKHPDRYPRRLEKIIAGDTTYFL